MKNEENHITINEYQGERERDPLYTIETSTRAFTRKSPRFGASLLARLYCGTPDNTCRRASGRSEMINLWLSDLQDVY